MDLATGLSVYGPLGIFAGLMVIVIRQLLTREQNKTDRMEQRNSDLIDYYRTTVIPALERSTSATNEAISFLSRLQEQQKIDDALERERLKRRGTENGV